MTAPAFTRTPAAGRLVCFNTCVYRIGEDGRVERVRGPKRDDETEAAYWREAQERMARLGEE